MEHTQFTSTEQLDSLGNN